jgi:hypothetical protein
MTDLRALHEAFAELERRADAAEALRPDRPQRTRLRLVPVVATMAAVIALVIGAALLVPGEKPAGGIDTAATAPTPGTPDELADRFREVLKQTATFTVTDRAPGAMRETSPDSPPEEVGAFIGGTLTASSRTGGFHLSIVPDAGPPTCEVLVDLTTCDVSRLADGSWLLTGTMRLEDSPNGLTRMVHLVRPDGVEIDLNVSNQRSPKGNSVELAPEPPLSVAEMTEIVTSADW